MPQTAKHRVTLIGGPEDGRKIHVRDRVKKLWSLVNPPVIYVVKTPCMGQCSWAEYARRDAKHFVFAGMVTLYNRRGKLIA